MMSKEQGVMSEEQGIEEGRENMTQEYVKKFDDFEKAANCASMLVWQTHVLCGKMQTEISQKLCADFFHVIRLETAYWLERMMKEGDLDKE